MTTFFFCLALAFRNLYESLNLLLMSFASARIAAIYDCLSRACASTSGENVVIVLAMAPGEGRCGTGVTLYDTEGGFIVLRNG